MNAAQFILQASGDVEIYTPTVIIEAARIALGGVISLDPASSEEANERVQALRWYGKEADGLRQTWDANTVWMNHPFSREGNRKWIVKFLNSYATGYFSAGCCITFASTSEAWFVPLMQFPQCFLHPRTNYLRPDGTVYRGVTKGSVCTYLGPDMDLFAKSFRHLGTIKIPYAFKNESVGACNADVLRRQIEIEWKRLNP